MTVVNYSSTPATAGPGVVASDLARGPRMLMISPAIEARSRLAKVKARYARAGSESSLRTRFKLFAASNPAACRLLKA